MTSKDQPRFGAQRADSKNAEAPKPEAGGLEPQAPEGRAKELHPGIDIPYPRFGLPSEPDRGTPEQPAEGEPKAPVYRVAPKKAVTSKLGILDQGAIVTPDILGCTDDDFQKLLTAGVVVKS